MAHSAYDYDKLTPAENLKIEHTVYISEQDTDISNLVALPLEQLQALRDESAAAEQLVFEKMREMVPEWERQAAQTKVYNYAIDYAKARAVEHTSNEWVKDEQYANSGAHISNMVYAMSHNVYEDTKYDRKTQKSVPVAWYLSWDVHTNSPGQNKRVALAGQSRKRFTNKADMEKYLAGRIKAYSHLFSEVSPSVPEDYANSFKVRGQLLPGYTIEGEAQKEQEAERLSSGTSVPKQTVDYDMAVTAPVSNAAKSAPIVLTADSPRGKLKEITDKLEQGIKDIFDSDNYKDYLKTLSKFHNYSFNNCILIAMQKPDATHVAGFGAWKDNFKRSVIKGEKGIKILAPTPYKIKKEMERIDPKSGSVVMGADGKALTDEVEITVPAFKVVNVFDISQTDGEPLPEIGVSELNGNVDEYHDFLSALEKTSPVPIGFEDIASEAKGYFEQEEKRIAIQSGMSELQTLKTAIHEIAHARLHNVDKNAPKDTHRPDRDTREVEAESVAYTVCQHYGFDTSDYSFGYIAGWSGAKELDTLKASLDTIRTEANAIITDVDGHMATLQKEHAAEKQTPDNFLTGEKIETPRGSFSLSVMTAEQMEAAGYGFHHSSDDGKYHIMGNGTRAFAINNPLQTAEMSTEQNLNMIDGVFNNAPTVSELEAKAKSGEVISLTELAGAVKAERSTGAVDRSADKNPSIREQLRQSKEQVTKNNSLQERSTKNKELEV